jgi:hypothetical protein
MSGSLINENIEEDHLDRISALQTSETTRHHPQHKDVIANHLTNSFSLNLSRNHIQYLACILSIRACRITGEQGQPNIASKDLIIIYNRSADEAGNKTHQIVFEHTPSGIVILEGRKATIYEHAVYSFMDALGRLVDNVM